MRKFIKIIVILGISVIVLPIYGIAHQMHYTWLSIPLVVGYIGAVSAVWKYKSKENSEKKFDIEKK